MEVARNDEACSRARGGRRGSEASSAAAAMDGWKSMELRPPTNGNRFHLAEGSLAGGGPTAMVEFVNNNNKINLKLSSSMRIGVDGRLATTWSCMVAEGKCVGRKLCLELESLAAVCFFVKVVLEQRLWSAPSSKAGLASSNECQ